MEKNIYDLVISELILKDSQSSNNGVSLSGAKIKLTNAQNVTSIAANTAKTLLFISEITDIPSGYTIKNGTHQIIAPGYNGSTSNAIMTSNINFVAGNVGTTITVEASAMLEKSGLPDIPLNITFTITAVLPFYFGLKAAPSGTPTTAGLTQQAITSKTIEFNSTNVTPLRLYIVLPNTNTLNHVIDSNGAIFPVSDFDLISSGSFKFYILKWDTIISASANSTKTFNINIQ